MVLLASIVVVMRLVVEGREGVDGRSRVRCSRSQGLADHRSAFTIHLLLLVLCMRWLPVEVVALTCDRCRHVNTQNTSVVPSSKLPVGQWVVLGLHPCTSSCLLLHDVGS